MSLLLLLLGCPPSALDSDSQLEGPGFSMMAQPFGQAALLSAWSDGEVLRVVGGDLGGGAGVLLRYEPSVPSVCVEDDSLERALWWIHGPAEGEWYAVGSEGIVLHHVDGETLREDLETELTLFGVWAESAERVWAVGGSALGNQGQVWLREGDAWSLFAELESPVFKVWEGWFVGPGHAWRLEDGELVEDSPEGAPTLTTVRGRSAEELFAVGGVGVLHSYSDGAWTALPAPFGQPLSGVWTAPDEPVWVAGSYGSVGVFDGLDWQVPAEPLTNEHFHAVWRHGDEMIFVGGDLYDLGDNQGVIARYGEDQQELSVQPCP